jgi:hypothetical protein
MWQEAAVAQSETLFLNKHERVQMTRAPVNPSEQQRYELLNSKKKKNNMSDIP